MSFKLNPLALFKGLIGIALLLFFINIVFIIIKFRFGHEYVHGLSPMFGFDDEQNIPTYYSSLLLLGSGGLLAIITLNHKQTEVPFLEWGMLSLIFLMLGIDEITCIHEMCTTPTKSLIPTSGFLHFAWVIPYGLFLIVFCVCYLRFLLRLPKHIMVLFITSGLLFVMGAMGFEMLGSRQAYLHGGDTIGYAMLYSFEELFEMIGTSLFACTLLRYIAGGSGSLSISVERDRAA